jgi:hypothetical protein
MMTGADGIPIRRLSFSDEISRYDGMTRPPLIGAFGRDSPA